MGAALDHVERDPKTGRLIYRRVYPLALRPFIPPPNVQLKRSLAAKTLDAPGVMERYRDAAAQYAGTVAVARRAASGSFDPLTPELIAFLVAAYKAEELGNDDEVRWLDRPLAVKARAALRSRMDLTDDLADSRALRALGDIAGIVAMWGDSANVYAESHLIRVDRTLPSFGQYCRAFNDTCIEIWEAMEQRLEGRSVPTPPMPAAPAKSRDCDNGPRHVTEESFDAIANALLANRREAISPSTRQGAQTALRFLMEALGPVTPAALTRRAVTEWLDLMAQRPARLPRAQRAATVRELATLYADRPEVPRLSPVTLDHHVGAVGTLWRKACVAGTIDEALPNPFKDRKSPTGPKRRKPKGFSTAEMQAVFALPIFTKGERPRRGRGEASYWLPLMLLWTGARPEEIAQMLVADIAKDTGGGRWTLTITDAGTHPVKGPQSLKTSKKDSGVRTFPVPAPLIDLGFLNYLAWLEASGETALFPRLTLKNARRLLFPTFGEWWSIYVREHDAIPAGGGRQPSREFRHSFATAARGSGIPREALEYLMGHRAAGATANEGYGEMVAFGLAIDRLTYSGLDLSRVIRWTPPNA